MVYISISPIYILLSCCKICIKFTLNHASSPYHMHQFTLQFFFFFFLVEDDGVWFQWFSPSSVFFRDQWVLWGFSSCWDFGYKTLLRDFIRNLLDFFPWFWHIAYWVVGNSFGFLGSWFFQTSIHFVFIVSCTTFLFFFWVLFLVVLVYASTSNTTFIVCQLVLIFFFFWSGKDDAVYYGSIWHNILHIRSTC